MIRVTLYCDICGKELPVREIETAIGKIEVVETGRTKVWDTSGLGKHLCKECALRIDNELLTFKMELLASKGGQK